MKWGMLWVWNGDGVTDVVVLVRIETRESHLLPVSSEWDYHRAFFFL